MTKMKMNEGKLATFLPGGTIKWSRKVQGNNPMIFLLLAPNYDL